MTDREMLELAAKAAGLDITGWSKQGGEEVAVIDGASFWQPLLKNSITDCDGDALRLAVALSICLRSKSPTHWQEPDTSVALYEFGDGTGERGRVTIKNGGNAGAATRRAIVRAAAEIGKPRAAPAPAKEAP